MISYVLRSNNNVAHYMATRATKENKEGEWKFDRFGVNMKSIVQFEERNVPYPFC